MTGDELQVNETMNITITCMATGLPAPIISYLRGNDHFGSSRFMRGPDSTVMMRDRTYQVTAMLTLTYATDGDTGNVTCLATNTVTDLNLTRMNAKTINLIVNG